MKIRIYFFLVTVILFSTIQIVFSQTYTLNTTKRGYVTNTNWEWLMSDMKVGFQDNFVVNDVAHRAFAWFDIPSDLQNAVITSVNLTVEVKDISKWNDDLLSVDLHPVNISWANFCNSTFGSIWDDGHWDMLQGGGIVAFISKTSSKTFTLNPNLIIGKSQVGFSFRAYPEIPSGILQSNEIILNNPTLIITYYFPSLTVTPPRLVVASTAGSAGNFEITSNTSWTVTDNATWLNLSRSSGTGNGTLTVTTTSTNTSANSRSASVTLSASGVNPVIVIVTQSGTSSTNSPPYKPQLLTPASGTSWSTPINLSWQCTDPDAGDVLNYILRIRRKGETSWMTLDVGTQTSKTISNWIPSELGTYEWSIVASDGEAASASDVWEYTLLNCPPNKPLLLWPSSGTSWSTQFNLAWQCIDPNHGDILTYTVRARRKGSTTWNPVSVGTQTSYTVSGWSSTDLGTWEWSVVASDGEAQTASDIWEFILIAENHPPNKPQLSTPGNGTSWSTPFNLTWQCTDPDPGDVLNFTLRARPKGVTTWNSVFVGTQISYTVSGWSDTDLGTYEWSVVADDGEAQTVSDIWEFTLITENHPPNKPQLLAPENGTSWSAPFNLSWQCTDPDPGDALTYTLRIRLKGTTTWYTESIGSQVTYNVSGWDDSDLGTYEWSVIASDGEAQNISDTWEFTLIKLTLNVTPSSITLASASAATGTLNVVSNTSWSVTDDATWLNLSAASGTGNGTLTVTTTSANTSTNPRSANVTFSASGVNSVIVIVTQAGTAPFLSATPTIVSVTSTSGSMGSINVGSNTSWSVTDDATWLNLSAASGTGNGTVTVTTANANTSTNPRSANVTFSASGVSSVIVVVTQAGTAPFLSATPTNVSVASTSGSMGSINVGSNTSWSVTDDATWLNLSAASGTGNGTLTVTTASANTSTNPRSANVTFSASGVSSVIVVVTQAGTSNSPPYKPTLMTPLDNSNNTLSFRFSWTCSDPDGDQLTYILKTRMKGEASWIDNVVNSQNYLDVFEIHHDLYNIPMEWCVVASDGKIESTSDIWEYIIITNQLDVSPNIQIVGVEAGNSTFNIVTEASWSITNHSEWLTVSPSMSYGNGTINVTYSANTLTNSRNGSITVSEQGYNPRMETVTVTQSGSAYLNTSTSALSIGYQEGSTNTFDITSNIDWTATSSDTWLSLNTNNGSGNVKITITAQRNPNTTSRTATISVLGTGVTSQSVTVTQSGAPAFLNVSSSALYIGYQEGSTNTFDITSNVDWTATNSDTWLSLNPTSGSGNVKITITAQENPNTSTRTATISISGTGVITQTITTTQEGAPTSVVEEEPQQLKIYPNPSNAILFIENVTNETKISIYDSIGKMKLNRQLTNDCIVDISNLISGVYFIEIVCNAHRKTFKLIVE